MRIDTRIKMYIIIDNKALLAALSLVAFSFVVPFLVSFMVPFLVTVVVSFPFTSGVEVITTGVGVITTG